jgi:nicotinamide phosphoribosyltransferase
MKLSNNLILNVDSYKASHWLQYPPNTQFVYSYIESRGGKYSVTILFGLQMFLKEYLSKPITMEMIDEAETFLNAHGEPFNRKGWEHIVNKHHGILPLEIKAVPEGMIVPTHNVLVTVENTDPECFWLTSYIETALLRAVWYGTTVASHQTVSSRNWRSKPYQL